MSFSEEDNEQCSELAAKVLDLNKTDLPLGIHFKELNCVYYSTPGENGKSVLACSDGEFLSSDNNIPMSIHIEAFKNGLRSCKKILENTLPVKG